ncbi:MAG: transposase [Bacteroidales bacterium]|jgi:REP element-mobilizing transposase RayT|nr:transposase [Bacteroidales bacterium]
MKPGSFTQLYVQLVIAVYMRDNALTDRSRPKVIEYIGGIVGGMKHKPLIVNGAMDHIHILLGLNPAVSISDTVAGIKKNSTLFINQNRLVMGQFRWQEGYGAFSYSRSELDNVYRYIQEQDKHHARKSFREEYMSLLDKNQADYDPRFLFEFLDSLSGPGRQG